MSIELNLTQTFSASPESVLDLLRNRDFVTDCVHAVSGPSAAVLTHEDTNGRLTVTSESPVPATVLPGPLRNLLPSNAKGTKTETWTKTANGYNAEIEIAVTGAPAGVTATATLTPSATGSCLTIVGTADVKIPFLGPKIEKMMIDQATERLTAEGDFINTRIA